jgi:acetyl esterase/lipase
MNSNETSDLAVQVLDLWPQEAPGARGKDREDRPWMEMVLPRGVSPAPAVIVCPGGGYCCRAEHEALPVARWLARRGIAGAVLHYRVSPYRHPVPLGDARRAIRLLRSQAGPWGIDPRRVGILGFSAGGHLAVSASTIDEEAFEPVDRIDRLSAACDLFVACYPVITFGENRHDGSMRALLGPDPDEALRRALSLENRVGPETPPGFIWHTADDAAVPVANALDLAGAMAEHSRPFALHVFSSGVHGLGLATEASGAVRRWPELLDAWLADQGFIDDAVAKRKGSG